MRLFGRIWFVVMTLSVLIAFALDINNERVQRVAKIESAIERVLLAWQAGADARELPGVSEAAHLGKQFILHDVILGGIVVSPTGGTLASFGQIPQLTWQDVHTLNMPHQPNPQDRTIDVSLQPLQTGLAHEVILRIPGLDHPLSKVKSGPGTAERVVRNIFLSFLVASTVAGLMLVFVIRPHWEMQRAASNGATAKYNVDSHRLRWNRKDTLGQTAKAIDTLISRLHYVRESELAPWKHVFSKTGLPILKFNPNGHLSEANDAAAELFEKANPAKLKELDFMLTTIPDSQQGSPLDISLSQKDGHFQGQVMLHTSKGNARVCFADITRVDGSDLRKNTGVQLVLVDATNFFTRLVTKEEEAKQLAITQRESNRTELLLRRQMEAFAFLAAPAKVRENVKEDAAAFISMERLINEWYQESVEKGASKDMLEHSALEAVSGDSDIVRNVVRQSYNMMYTLSGELTPQINISSKLMRGGMAEFTIEQIPDLNGAKTPIPEEMLSWSYNFDALKKALQEAGGQMVYFDATTRPINLIIRLPAFRTSSIAKGAVTAITEEEYSEMKKAG